MIHPIQIEHPTWGLCDGVRFSVRSLSPMKRDSLWRLFPKPTWERHAVTPPPVQCQRRLVPSAHVIHCQNDLIPGAVGQARQRLSTWQTRRSTHRVEDPDVNEHVLVASAIASSYSPQFGDDKKGCCMTNANSAMGLFHVAGHQYGRA